MKPSMVETYLFFGGRCEEAMQFYQKALGAKVIMQMKFSESPQPVPADRIPPGFQDKIMHASLSIGSTRIMASDGCDVNTPHTGFSLAFSVDNEPEAHRAFAALAEGGKVTMPLTKTFWSPCYGLVEDRFGINWMVMVPGEMG
ncbi:MAG: VOC family protein [Gemmatales bacterium]